MNINLANIDFVPGQGGGGEAVIRSLDVTENGTYSAPSGVDGYSPVNVNVSGGGSLTPEEQEALDTLVDSSEGVLYTQTFKRYYQNKYDEDIQIIYKVFDDLYCINNGNLYKLNKKTYKLDFINHFEGLNSELWGDKSGRLYGNNKELNLEDGTLGQTSINVPELFSQASFQNVFYGEYGVWTLGSNNAYKFNESTQEFEQMPLNITGVDTSPVKYCNMFKYDGHILGVWFNKTFELTEYEDHIDVADVTDVYFNMSSNSSDLNYYTTNDGDLYFINDYGFDLYKYDKSSGYWESITNKDIQYSFEKYYTLGLDNFVYCANNNILTYMNLGVEFSTTSWKKLSNVAVDLKSDQEIKGIKDFKGQVSTTQLFVENIYTSGKDMKLDSGSNKVNITGNNIVFTDYESNETVVKNGSKQIATVDQTFINSTFIPYGVDGDNIGDIGVNGPYDYFNFNTYTNRLFINGDPSFNGVANWYEFKGKSTFDLVSFDVEFGSENVVNSPTMTISSYQNNTYMWNDENTRWDLICTAPGNVHPNDVWFDGDNFRYKNSHKLVNTDGVWSWVSDPLNNIWKSYYRFGYKNGEVYAYHSDNNWHLYKYDKVNHTMNAIGFLNAGYKLFSYFNEMFFVMNDNNVYIIDLSKVDPNNPDLHILGKALFKVEENGRFIGATDRLWYYNDNMEMCSSYENKYEKPEVPASDGTYTLKAVRAGDQITYNWVLDA